MPVFGTGAGGFDRVRGEVLDRLLTVLQGWVTTSPYDVVLVCHARADYAAVQARRRAGGSDWPLDDVQRAHATRLGGLARHGDLVLFLGAGVSVAAGLPTWTQLLDRLAGRTRYAGREDELRDLAPQDAAALIVSDLGAKGFRKALRASLRRDQHALAHGLLATVRVDQAVTTNYDDLYELAAIVPFQPERLRLLPWQRVSRGQPWLLKMHGDVRRGSVVLSRADYLDYDVRRRSLGGLVQALLLTKHMLFVGFSLTDDNFVRLAHDVAMLLHDNARGRKAARRLVGTALMLRDEPVRRELWERDLHTVAMLAEPSGDRGADRARAARRLEVFLDCVAMEATDERPYLLDDRYQVLVETDPMIRARLREVAALLPAAQAPLDWDQLRALLRGYGAAT